MARTSINPLIIPLKDLPDEGKTFVFNRAGGEMNEGLKDLIGDNPYEVRFVLRPLGNTYELSGLITTALDLQCARCAYDIRQEVRETLKEILIVNRELSRTHHLTETSSTPELIEDGPGALILASPEFDALEYAHEVIALTIPIRPLKSPECETSCENLRNFEALNQVDLGADAKNPFSVLKGLKLKN